MIYLSFIVKIVALIGFIVMTIEVFKIRKLFNSHIWVPIVMCLSLEFIQILHNSILIFIELLK